MKARIGIASAVVSGALLVGIAIHESFSPVTYLDSVGVPTLGFGTTTGVKPGDKTTPERALMRLLSDVENVYAAGVKACVKVPLYQHEFDSFVSLTYNIGVDAFCKSTLVKKVNAGDYAGACAEMSRWVYAGGKDCRVRANNCYGLVVRREKERAMCEGK